MDTDNAGVMGRKSVVALFLGGTLLIGALVGFFLGAFFAPFSSELSALPPQESVPTESRLDAQQEDTHSSVSSRIACFDAYAVKDWKSSPQRAYFTEHFSGSRENLFTDAFDQAIQEKLSEGWQLTLICVNAPQIYGVNHQAVYFSMTDAFGKADAAEVAFRLPRGTESGTLTVLGYWLPDTRDLDDAIQVHPVQFSEPFSIHGIGDIGYVTELSLKRGSGPVTVFGSTGGGDGPFGWDAVVAFQPEESQVTVANHCTYSYFDSVPPGQEIDCE